MNKKQIEKLGKLNDTCRKLLMVPIFGIKNIRHYYTPGIRNLSPEDQIVIAAKIRDFDSFSIDNNPYGERDFGRVEHNGINVFWKIDYYDLELKYASEDPSNEDVTTRVLTVMLAEEY